VVAAASSVRTPKGHADYWLLSFVTVLVVIGLQAVYSATFALAITEYHNVFYFLMRQAMGAALGVALLFACMSIDYRWWRFLSPFIFVGALVSLVLVIIPGFSSSQYGASRWLQIGPLPAVQPSEFMKIAMILVVAAWLSSSNRRVTDFKTGLLPIAGVVGIVSFLIMKQPDFGTVLVIILTAGTMYFLAGASLTALTMIVLSGLAGGAFLITTAAYRVERWQSFLNPWQDPQGIGFHIIQLLIALGTGGITGLGIGASRQKFFYVPGAHTDGIFAIIGEELGFIGCMVVILLFAAVIYRGARIVQHAPDRFGALLASGIVAWIAYQTLINIGGITQAIPLTGIPLPFISYGGSSLAATMAAVGILLSISRYLKGTEPTQSQTLEAR